VSAIKRLQASERSAVATASRSAKARPGDRPLADPSVRFSRHLLQRTVVVPELRVLYVPVPKAGSTTVLWLLAELAGIPLESFAVSTLPEVSPATTVHDMTLWGDERRLGHYEGDERERVLTEEGWFRFSVVRHPASRLWSAWQSKLLLREPRFVAAFGDEPWFPRVPEQPSDLVEDFRHFVAALAGGGAEDVHWAVQYEVLEHVPLTHVGHVEQLHETLALLRAHAASDRWPAGSVRENRSTLAMPPHAFDGASATILEDRYAADFRHYGYEPLRTSDDGADVARWEEDVASLLPLLRDAIDKHARIGQLHRLVRRVHTLEERLETTSAAETAPAAPPVLTNLEGHTEFNARWAWADGPLEPGFTAVVRVKNEARSLPWVLPPLLRAVRRVVVVDNGSTDGSAAVAHRVADAAGAADRLDLYHYPFSVARCGQEHLDTPARSVHSLAYFYNWSFSHVSTRYALKWDGDMVLAETLVNVLRDLAWQLEASEAIVRIPRYPVYIADERRAFLDTGIWNREPWAWPNGPGYSFGKAMEWELSPLPAHAETIVLPTWSCLELKYLDADEFAHWSHTDFDVSARTRRKQREWDIFQALANGREPPEGQHVVDYVRSVWLPARANADGVGNRIVMSVAGAGRALRGESPARG
jgi:hypothetical protein